MSDAALSGWLPRVRKPSAMPGFGLTLGFTVSYLSLIVLIPLAVLVARAGTLGLDGIWRVATTPRVLAALEVSFFISAAAALVNAVFGVIVAWVLVRYEFPGKRLLDAAVDLPFALPTAVAGIALAALYAENGWIGSLFAPWGIKIAFTPLGILVALVFIGLPFVVRTVQPVLQDLDREVEEASATLGATRRQTVFRVVLPGAHAGAADRRGAGLRPRRRRVRLGDLHRRQHAVRVGDRAAAHRHQARGVRLCRRRRHRHGDAGDLLPGAARHQRPAGLQPPAVRPCVAAP